MLIRCPPLVLDVRKRTGDDQSLGVYETGFSPHLAASISDRPRRTRVNDCAADSKPPCPVCGAHRKLLRSRWRGIPAVGGNKAEALSFLRMSELIASGRGRGGVVRRTSSPRAAEVFRGLSPSKLACTGPASIPSPWTAITSLTATYAICYCPMCCGSSPASWAGISWPRIRMTFRWQLGEPATRIPGR